MCTVYWSHLLLCKSTIQICNILCLPQPQWSNQEPILPALRHCLPNQNLLVMEGSQADAKLLPSIISCCHIFFGLNDEEYSFQRNYSLSLIFINQSLDIQEELFSVSEEKEGRFINGDSNQLDKNKTHAMLAETSDMRCFL